MVHRLRNLLGLLPLLFILSSCVFAAPSPQPTENASWMIGPFTKADTANPILGPMPDATFDDPMTGKSVTWESDNVFNPAAVVRNGMVYVLYRAEDHSGEGIGRHTSRIGLASSRDGLHFTPQPLPVLFPDGDKQKDYEWTGGCEDPRCVETPDGGYLLMYTEWNRDRARLAAATSRDLVHWQKHGPVFAAAYNGRFLNEWSKSGSVVTEQRGDHLIAAKIAGKYWMYYGEGTVNVAASTDLVNWQPVLDAAGNPVHLLETRPGKFDSALCESGPPAVVRKQGIVFIYNGKNADQNGDPSLKPGAYAAGQALFDANDPTKLLERTNPSFIKPERSYEANGQYAAGTVFTEGLVRYKKRWYLYYGTADSHVAAASAP